MFLALSIASVHQIFYAIIIRSSYIISSTLVSQLKKDKTVIQNLIDLAAGGRIMEPQLVPEIKGGNFNTHLNQIVSCVWSIA